MTTPNWDSPSDIPIGSANYGGLAAFAAKTQTDWENEFKAPFETNATNFLEGLFGDLPTGGPFGLTLVTEIVKQLLDDPTATFTSISDAISAIGTWALDLIVGGVSAVLQQIDEFFTNIPNLSTWLTTFQTLIDGLLGITNFSTFVDTLKTVINSLVSVTGLSTFLDTLKTLITGLLGISSFESWVAGFKTLVDFFNGLVTSIGSTLWTVLTEIVNFFTDLFDGSGSVTDFLGNLPLVGDVIDVINSLTGGAYTAISEGLTGLVEWAQKLPVVGTLVSALLGSWVNPVTGTNTTLPDLIAYATKLVTDESAVLARNLLGFIPFELISLIPTGFVGNTAPNLVTDQGFSSSAVLQTGNGWTWDNTNNVDSAGGSAKVVGDGGVKQLFSNLIAVTEGQTLSLSTSVKWTKGTTATPIFLIGLRGYDASEAQTFTTTVSSISGKSGSINSSTSNNYNLGTNTTATFSNGWVKIEGTSTAIPAGTTQVRVLLGMTNGPSGTTAWFDDVYAGKTALLGQGLVDGLVDGLLDLLPKDTHQALLDILGKTPNANLSTVLTEINKFLTGTSTLNGSNIGTGDIDANRISQLINTWVQTVLGLGGQTTTGSPDLVAQKLSDLAIAVKGQTTVVQGNTQEIGKLITRVNNLETAKDSTPNGILARLTALETKVSLTPVTPPSTGTPPVSVFDTFDGRTTMGANWVVYETFSNGNSLLIPNSQDAQYVCPQFNSSTQQVMAIWNGTGKKSATTFQKIFCTFGSAAGIPAVGSMGFNDLIGLANPAIPRSGIVWRFYANGTSKVFYRTGSLEADPWNPSGLLGSFSAPISTATGKPIQPTTGTPVELYIGDKAGIVGSPSTSTVLYATIGGARLGPVTIGASIIAAMGSTQGWGFGMGQGLSAGILGQGASQVPASLAVWGAQDQ